MSLVCIAVGEPYPGRVVEGIMLELFAPGGTLLFLGAPGIGRAEALRYRRGKPGLRVRAPGDVLHATWLFGGLVAGETVFDARLARDAGHLELPDLGPDTRIGVQLHVVDTATGLLRGLRVFTLSPAASTRIAEIVQARLAT